MNARIGRFWVYEKKFYFCTAKFVRWCNGSTGDFGSLSLGSSPGRTTKPSDFQGVFYFGSEFRPNLLFGAVIASGSKFLMTQMTKQPARLISLN